MGPGCKTDLEFLFVEKVDSFSVKSTVFNKKSYRTQKNAFFASFVRKDVLNLTTQSCFSDIRTDGGFFLPPSPPRSYTLYIIKTVYINMVLVLVLVAAGCQAGHPPGHPVGHPPGQAHESREPLTMWALLFILALRFRNIAVRSQ